jgi:hypothetical protein
VGVVGDCFDAGVERLYFNMRSPGGDWKSIRGWMVEAMFLMFEPLGPGV